MKLANVSNILIFALGLGKTDGLRFSSWGECPDDDSNEMCDKYLGVIEQFYMRKDVGCLNVDDMGEDSCEEMCTFKVEEAENDGYVCAADAVCNACRPTILYEPTNRKLQQERLHPMTQETMNQVVSEIPKGNLSATFLVKPNVLTPAHAAILKKFADKTIEERIANGEEMWHGKHVAEDYMFNVSPFSLRDMLGADVVAELRATFSMYDPRYEITRIRLRRSRYADFEHHMDWHTDGDNMGMHVWLSEDEVTFQENGNAEAAKMMYINHDGVTSAPLTHLSALVHGNNAMHLVAPWAGTRYFLLIIGDGIGRESLFKEYDNEASRASTAL